jgi:hypothetical protein
VCSTSEKEGELEWAVHLIMIITCGYLEDMKLKNTLMIYGHSIQIILLLLNTVSITTQTLITYSSGDMTPDSPGTYGTKGVQNATNFPSGNEIFLLQRATPEISQEEIMQSCGTLQIHFTCLEDSPGRDYVILEMLM